MSNRSRKDRRTAARAQLTIVAAAILVCALWTDREAPREAAALPVNPPKPLLASCADCNVLLVSIDTLRADHVGAYGYPRATSPGLDALAQQGTVFERAYSTAYVTADAHMSIFTSLYPSVHGVRNASAKDRRAHRLSHRIGTLPEHLKTHGFATAGFTSGGNVSAAYGFDRGMDRYEVHTETTVGVDRAVAFMRDQSSAGSRFFVFLHTYDAHDPYLPGYPYDGLFGGPYTGKMLTSRDALHAAEPDLSFRKQRDAYWARVDKRSQRDLDRLISLYDGEIRRVDTALARLWKEVRRIAPRTLIVVTSDHGEQFSEHGAYLHNDIFEELLHVPLIVVHPSGATRARVPQALSTVDIAPTLVEVLGLPTMPQAQGVSFASHVDVRPVLAEKAGGVRALIKDNHKLIYRESPGRLQLFDLASDPHEKRNLAHRDEQLTGSMKATLSRTMEHNEQHRRKLLENDVTTSTPLDDQLAAQLEALGYVR